ncbi:MAG: hybrid sensor histidine kinase/response regulator [Chloroflexota bacterium]
MTNNSITPTTSILVVDDVPANLELLTGMLKKQGYRARPALSGAIALKSARAAPPDLILLDISMPDLDGYQVCEQLKADELTHEIPVIFLSAFNETTDKVRAFEVGGVDYITKPFQFEEVMARVECHLTLQRQRREIQELSAFKDEMMRTVSHDLKNPLYQVMGLAEMLELDIETLTIEEILDYSKDFLKAGQKMFRLISDLLDISVVEGRMTLNLVPCQLADFLSEHLHDHQLMAQNKHLQLHLEAVNNFTLLIDKDRMGRVIDNLLSNAIKYTPEGGQVVVTVQASPDRVLIKISDNGLGIPTDAISHVFDKFYRVHRKEHMTAEGTGLGLSIVKTIVEQHGGRIWVESELGVGSAFNVLLPITETIAA